MTGGGTCCSPIINTFLSTYVVSHSNGVKKGVLSFVSFFVGKLISVTFLCMVAFSSFLSGWVPRQQAKPLFLGHLSSASTELVSSESFPIQV